MKVLALSHFYKTVPKEKEQAVNERISYLIRALEETKYNFESLPSGIDLKKMESVKQRIYKFKIQGGDRVLCTKGEYLDSNIEKEYRNSLVLLEFSNHDAQGRKAKHKKYSSQSGLQNPQIVKSESEQLEDVPTFSLHAPTTIIKNIEVDKGELVNVFGEEGKFYYLDPTQKELVNVTDKGQFVFGSAGSGKTTISVYKIIDFLKRTKETDEKVAYFTFSTKLKEQTERLFERMAMEIYGLERSEFQKKVEFYTVEEYLEQSAALDGKILTYEKFKEWFENQGAEIRFDPVGLWKERRGIFQGMIGANWQYSVELPIAYFDKKILQVLHEKNYIRYPQKKTTFLLNTEMNTICSLLEAEFGSSVPFRNKIISEYNKQITAKMELSLTEYKNLKDRDSLYTKQERPRVVNIFNRFHTYVKQNLNRNGLFDEGEIVRQAIKNSQSIFGFIIIDEVQDLTELQVYYLCQLLKQKNNVFVCGDFHQTINPTFFNVGRIESIFRFLGGRDNFSSGKLEKNYRSSKNIVEFANEISCLRKNSIATNEDFNYTEIPLRGETRKPYVYLGNKDLLWNYVKDKSYVYVVVGTEQTKLQLMNEYPDLESRIMTVSEIKGIENRYIISYNILSEFKSQWADIFSQLEASTKLKSEVYRYYFNVLYVAITRARDVLGMVEDDIPELVSNWLMETMDVITKFDIDLLGLKEQSSDNDLLNNAMALEQEGAFDQAIATYKSVLKKGDNDLKNDAETGIKRCQYKKDCKLTKDYTLCGERLLELREFDEAIPFLQRGKNPRALLKAILLSNTTERYDIGKEMEKFKTNPLKVLVDMNDDTLTNRFTNNEIEPFTHVIRELVVKSNKLVKPNI